VWVAANDRGRNCSSGRLGDGCLGALPPDIQDGSGADAIRLIDILWLDRGGVHVAAAFEVEHSTSSHSGIVRLLDLAATQAEGLSALSIVAPDEREEEVRKQLARPAFQSVAALQVRYLPYGELQANRAAMAGFGAGLKAVEAVARRL